MFGDGSEAGWADVLLVSSGVDVAVVKREGQFFFRLYQSCSYE